MKPPLINAMFKRGGSLFLFIFIFSNSVLSQKGQFTYNSEIKEIYNLITDLRLDEAKTALATLSSKDKNNLALIHMANYIDFFTLFVTENRKLYAELSKNESLRLSQIKERSNKSDPYAKFVSGEIKLQWALVKLKFNERISAASNIYDAYRMLEENDKEHPDFINNNKSLSILFALAESVPLWLRKIIKVKGSVVLAKKQIEELHNYAQNNDYFFKDEVLVAYAYILHYQLNDKDKAWKIIQNSDFSHVRSPMKAFIKATYALKNGKNDLALKFAKEAPRSKNYLPFYYLDFIIGKCYLQQLNPEANNYFKKYISGFNGIHYIKECYQKLAWSSLLFDLSPKEYNGYMNFVKQKGSVVTDEDIQALNEAEKGKIPDLNLLKARLLFDGGYYMKAYKLLTDNKKLEKSPESKLEYQYRMGRILQNLEQKAEAISFYSKAASNENTSSYMVSNSLLNLGAIYEGLNNKPQALKFYNRCLATDPDEYKNSIHQKARSGVSRVKSS